MAVCLGRSWCGDFESVFGVPSGVLVRNGVETLRVCSVYPAVFGYVMVWRP
jgi:hypothetical protein